MATAPFRQTSKTGYQDYQRQLSPTALLSTNGAAFEAALGSVKDIELDRVFASVKARFPGIAPEDALAIIGAERGIQRGQSETAASYAARLVAAWTSWPWAGTPYGMLSAFRSTGYTNVVIAQPRGGKQFTLDANGVLVIGGSGTWTPTYVGDPFWSRFDVLFPSPLPASWIAGGVPASNSAEANFIRALIQAWKPAHATPNRIIIVSSGKVWGYPSTQVWGAATGNWGAATVTFWTP
jgi:hypothetical protein